MKRRPQRFLAMFNLMSDAFCRKVGVPSSGTVQWQGPVRRRALGGLLAPTARFKELPHAPFRSFPGSSSPVESPPLGAFG